MTAPDTGHTVQPQAKSAVTIRAVSWALLAMLLALLINNVLNISFEIDTELRLNNPLPVLTYLMPIFAAFLFARRTPNTALAHRCGPHPQVKHVFGEITLLGCVSGWYG
jgi:hypothetical protein